MANIAEESAAVTRLAMRLLAGFAAIAFTLAAIGVYGMMSYRVRRRRRELGVRLALGATPGALCWMVLRQAVTTAAIGLILGTVATMVAGRTLSSILFGVTASDPGTLAIAAALLAAATVAASYLPARRAARVDPVSVLSAE